MADHPEAPVGQKDPLEPPVVGFDRPAIPAQAGGVRAAEALAGLERVAEPSDDLLGHVGGPDLAQDPSVVRADHLLERIVEGQPRAIAHELDTQIGVEHDYPERAAVHHGDEGLVRPGKGELGGAPAGDVGGRGHERHDPAVGAALGRDLQVDAHRLAARDADIGLESLRLSRGGLGGRRPHALAQGRVVTEPRPVPELRARDIGRGEPRHLEPGLVDVDQGAVRRQDADEGDDRVENLAQCRVSHGPSGPPHPLPRYTRSDR